ncbi:MAG: SDR family NAD(P)-dependent oxidoreductase [Actinobacteria bacterium]|nr:SDR family NAD(P)-dependent oxidoreductase [Actinomycetota bacterium]
MAIGIGRHRREPGWLKGKVALVTGAASGLGRGIALALARAGCDLVLVDINEARLRDTAAAIEGAGRRCLAKRVDVSSRAEMEKLAEEVLSEWGRVDVLVNNAGVGVGGELVNIPMDDIEWITGINLMGEIYGARLFLPQMIARGEGHVVNVGSLSSLVVLPFHIAYTTTKFGIAGFTEALWAECRRHGVGVTLVCPGAVSTNIAEGTRAHPGSERQKEMTEEFERMLEEKGMDPEEAGEKVVEAVLSNRFLLILGREAYILYYLRRLFPGLMRRVVAFLTAYASKQ